jgi:pyruvate kinase
VGEYPVEVVRVMARIAEEIETLVGDRFAAAGRAAERTDRQHALARAACRVAEDIGAVGIVAFTMTGATARCISQHRPLLPVYALTPRETTSRRMALLWGVRPVLFPLFASTDEMIERGEARLLELGHARVGDTFVCVAGASTSTPGGTDILKIHYFDGKNPYLGQS